jgi:hypothetical protein
LIIGVETGRYQTIGELRRGLDMVRKKTGDSHDLNEIATAIFFRRAIWFRCELGSVVATVNESALLVLLGWGREMWRWRGAMTKVLIAHAQHNGLSQLQMRSPRQGWVRVLDIQPQGDLYEVKI